MPASNVHQTDDPDELLDLSRANGQALILATAAFLEETGLPISSWVESIAARFASSWDPAMEIEAGALLDLLLTNYRSLGAEVVDSDLSERRAMALIEGFPNEGLCSELGIDCELAMPYLDVPVSLASAYGYSWSWTREDGRIRLVVSKVGD